MLLGHNVKVNERGKEKIYIRAIKHRRPKRLILCCRARRAENTGTQDFSSQILSFPSARPDHSRLHSPSTKVRVLEPKDEDRRTSEWR